jgi:hypothetical protein
VRRSKFFRPAKLNIKLFTSPERYAVGDDLQDIERDTLINLTLVYLMTMGRPRYLREEIVRDIFEGQANRDSFNKNVVGELRTSHPLLMEFIDCQHPRQIAIDWEAGISVDVHECRYLINHWAQTHQDHDTGLEYLVEALDIFTTYRGTQTDRLRQKWGGFYHFSEYYGAFKAWRDEWDEKIKQEIRWATEQLVRIYSRRQAWAEAESTLQRWLLWDKASEVAFFHQLQVFHWQNKTQEFNATTDEYLRAANRPVTPQTRAEIDRLIRRKDAKRSHAEDLSPSVFCKIDFPQLLKSEVEDLSSYQKRFLEEPRNPSGGNAINPEPTAPLLVVSAAL